MSTTTGWSKEALSVIRSVPTDLAGVVGYVIVAVMTVEFVTMSPPLRAMVVTPLLLFAPGYALVAAVYPRQYTGNRRSRLRWSSDSWDSSSGLHPIERVLLSFGVSVALIPLFGVTLWAAVSEISRSVVLFWLAAFTLATVVVATVRRFSLPADERVHVPVSPQVRRFRAWFVGLSAGETVVNVFLVAAILLAATTFVYAFAVPTTGESYTTAMLVTEQNGEYVTSGYPTTFTAGEPESLTLQLTNHEGTETEYTVIAAVEVVDQSDASVILRSELDRYHLSLQPGETVHHDHSVAPETTGEDLRLSYYVYKGDVSETPDISNAYRDLHVWITVNLP